jgi:hypothetical protein
MVSGMIAFGFHENIGRDRHANYNAEEDIEEGYL